MDFGKVIKECVCPVVGKACWILIQEKLNWIAIVVSFSVPSAALIDTISHTDGPGWTHKGHSYFQAMVGKGQRDMAFNEKPGGEGKYSF